MATIPPVNNGYQNPADIPNLTPEAKAQIQAQQQMQAQNMADSMAQMRLQNEQQKQNRAIESLSTTLKNGHDTAKSVIRNTAVS